jgi:hypothetical protein
LALADDILVRLNKSYLDAVHDEYDKTQVRLLEQNNLMYRNVLGAHIRHGIFRENGETNITAFNKPDYESDMKAYFEAVPDILIESTN